MGRGRLPSFICNPHFYRSSGSARCLSEWVSRIDVFVWCQVPQPGVFKQRERGDNFFVTAGRKVCLSFRGEMLMVANVGQAIDQSRESALISCEDLCNRPRSLQPTAIVHQASSFLPPFFLSFQVPVTRVRRKEFVCSGSSRLNCVLEIVTLLL